MARKIEIIIKIDEKGEKKTLNYIVKDKFIQNYGSIAKSCTYEFQKILQSGDTNLIGLLGVVFY